MKINLKILLALIFQTHTLLFINTQNSTDLFSKNLTLGNFNNDNNLYQTNNNFFTTKDKTNFNIWSDYFSTTELIIYIYKNLNNTIKLKNKKNIFLNSRNILDISPPMTISQNPYYRKFQITLDNEFINSSDCSLYYLKEYNYVSIKNCTFQLFENSENFISDFNLLTINMQIDDLNINQCIIESSGQSIKADSKEILLDYSNTNVQVTPEFLLGKFIFSECKQSFCTDLNSTGSSIISTLYEPLFGEYNFQVNFSNLDEYEFELFRAYLIVRNQDYQIETINKEKINNFINLTNNNVSNIGNIDSINKNEIAFFTDVTKILQTKGNKYQLALEVFPQFFDLKLIFDVQRIKYDSINQNNTNNNVSDLYLTNLANKTTEVN